MKKPILEVSLVSRWREFYIDIIVTPFFVCSDALLLTVMGLNLACMSLTSFAFSFKYWWEIICSGGFHAHSHYLPPAVSESDQCSCLWQSMWYMFWTLLYLDRQNVMNNNQSWHSNHYEAAHFVLLANNSLSNQRSCQNVFCHFENQHCQSDYWCWMLIWYLWMFWIMMLKTSSML